MRGRRTVGQHNPFRYQTREIIIRRVGLAHIPTKSQHDIGLAHRWCRIILPLPTSRKIPTHIIPNKVRCALVVQDDAIAQLRYTPNSIGRILEVATHNTEVRRIKPSNRRRGRNRQLVGAVIIKVGSDSVRATRQEGADINHKLLTGGRRNINRRRRHQVSAPAACTGEIADLPEVFTATGPLVDPGNRQCSTGAGCQRTTILNIDDATAAVHCDVTDASQNPIIGYD